MLERADPSIFETLQVNLGTAYVNDFNVFGRVYQVRAQADQRFRIEQADISRAARCAPRPARWCRSARWSTMRDVTGPDLVQRYNMYTSVPLQGERGARRLLRRRRCDAMEQLAREACPPGIGLRVDRARLPGARRPATRRS